MNYEKTPGEIAVFANQRTKEREYWLNRLAGEWIKSYFPYDNKKESGQTDNDMKSEKTTQPLEFSFTGEPFTALEKLSRGIDLAIHAIAAAAINILLYKYTGNQDIIIGTPATRQTFEGAFINTVLVLRNRILPRMTFKQLLLQMKQTIDRAIENQNYPVEILPEQLNRSAAPGEGFPLFDVSIMLENIHDNKYLQHIDHNFAFSFKRTANTLEGNVRYNSSLYQKETIRRVITHLTNIFNQVLANLDMEIREIEMTTDDEKKQLIYQFNDTAAVSPTYKTIHQWFEDQVQKAPGKIAVCSPIDSGDIFIPTSCFKKNPYIYETDLRFDYHPGNTDGTINLKLLKTPAHNSVVVNRNMWKLINLFDGERNIESIFSRLQSENLKDIKWVIYTKETGDLLEITHDFNRQAEIFSNMDLVAFISLVRLLYTNYIIEPTAVKSNQTGLEKANREDFTDMDKAGLIDDRIVLRHLLNPLENKAKKLPTADVLLLGDTPGMPSSGLLYLASYLKRNGIKAYCRFYDNARDLQAMKSEIEELLQTLQPNVVAISLKWFLYIARVLDMCRIVREYSQKNAVPITIVLGGNTGSFYWENIIDEENIDYIIRGDGELPLLKICQGENPDNIPNCAYKINGKTRANPITFIKNETNSSDIYLSHLEEILLWNKASLFGTFFIYTHLGCGMNCFYCGGCRPAQQKAFNRETAFIRPPAEVKKDILEALPLVSTFHFDFDIVHKDLVGYCRKIWEGIDLSGHFCLLNSLKPPSPDLIELAAKTFLYVYWDLDVLTLSQRHRQQLFSMGLVKPQLTDEEILSVLDRCDGYDNVEVRINLINGLPYLLPEDIDAAQKFLDMIMSRHRSFSELHWGRLHAQPGAPILEEPGKYDMHAFASTYPEFLEYSKRNFNTQSPHQRLEHLNYPYVYFNDESLNSKLSLHFSETDKKIQKYKESIRTNRIPVETITYEQLNKKAYQLAQRLKASGVTTGTIAALMLTPSIHIPLAILAVLETGAAYLPIDPDSPEGRVQYMLKDSNARILLKKTEIRISKSETNPNDRNSNVQKKANSYDVLDFETLDFEFVSNFEFRASNLNPSSLAYVIYTSGTTGKPKGVLLSHQNLVNYVTWFTRETHLTSQDKTMLISSYAFDLGYTTLYSSLLVGGELHVLTRDIYLSSDRLLNYIDQKGITYIKTTPSLFKPIVNSPGFSVKKCRTLRLAVIGGEPIDIDDIETAHALCPHLEIINHYGPTEATIGCIARYIDFNRFEEYKMTPTIGRPIANTRVYILNQDFNLQPIGLPGELCISGTGLARGYLNRPELTSEKFCLPQPGALFEKTAPGPHKNFLLEGTRGLAPLLYHTGDLARWLPDGTINFLGRIDKQIKIRGYRIELEEIKNQLTRHPQIKDAVVIDRQDKKGDKYLCAYFVPEPREMEVNENKKTLTLEEIAKKENMPTPPGDNHVSIPALFQEQVEKYHDHIARESQGKPWTYETLNNYTNQVARLILENYDDRCQLSEKELVRYKRQMLLHGWGQAFQEKLKQTTVFIAGAGGGASPTMMQLALLGFGTIIICDFDEIELSNLNRQFLHDEERLGMNKALSAKLTINRTNPEVNVIPITKKLTRENVFEIVGNSDIIFDMFDGPADKFILSECAVVKKIPHVIISMADLNSYTAIFHTPKTPCYHCIFSKEKLEAITAGMKSFDGHYSKRPLAVASTSLFTSTGAAISEVLKILLGLEEPAYNKLFYFNHRGANQDLRNTPSFQSMTHLFTEHFRGTCKNQGFDWEIGWRGNLIEVLDITPDPGCPVCGEKGKERRLALERKMQQQTAGLSTQPYQPQNNTKTTRQVQVAALLMDDNSDDLHKAASLIGILKAGKTYVPLAPSLPGEKLSDILSQSRARIIVTDNKNLEKAKKMRDRVNKAIPVLDVTDIDNSIRQEKPDVDIHPTDIAYILFPPDSTPSPQSIKQSHNQVLEFLHRCTRHLQDNTNSPQPLPSLSHYPHELKTPMLELLGSILNADIPFAFPRDRDRDRDRDRETSNYLLPQLKEHLLKELPEYMIPSYFIQLEKIPLTPNGKIDQKALPEPETAVTVEKYSPPTNETEEKLVRIWSELLGIEKEKIGIQHNFFELGGNSLNLILLVSAIHKEFGIETPINQIFDNPTIKDIANSLGAKNFADKPVMLLNRLKEKKLFLFPPQIAYGVFYMGLAYIIEDYSFYAFSFIEEEDRLKEYVKIMKDLQPEGPFIMFGYSAAGRLIFEITKALQNQGREVSDIIFLDCIYYENKPFIIEDEFMAEHYKFIEEFLEKMGAPFLKEQIVEKSGKFIKYCQNTSPLEPVNAVIHLILTEEARETEDPHCWDKLTTKTVVTYDGYGPHMEVFSPGRLEKNAGVLREVLTGIELRKK